MIVSPFWSILCIAIVLSVSNGHWEVINDVTEAETENINLKDELLIPADVPLKKGSEAARRSQESLNQSKENKITYSTESKQKATSQPHLHHHVALTSAAKPAQQLKNAKKDATAMTSKKSRVLSTNPSVSLKTSISLQNDIHENSDEIDLISEGFLLVKNKRENRSPNSRKLAQFTEYFSQDSMKKPHLAEVPSSNATSESDGVFRTRSRNASATKLSVISQQDDRQLQFAGSVHRHSTEFPRQEIIVEQTTNRQEELQKPQSVNMDVEAILRLREACVVESSWECKMFRGDLQSMRTGVSRSSANERSRRQASSSVNTGVTAGVLGCEQGDCFSGNFTDPDEEEVVPEFSFKSVTKTKINKTDADLNNKTRQKLANKLQEQLMELFKDVPGFKNVSVDPDRIRIDSDGNMVIQWKILIDGGNPIFSGMNGKEVRDTIEGALVNASDIYNTAIIVDGKPPTNNFNSTDAADQVQRQANDPCKMVPSPCPKGFGGCERLPNCGRGIELKCIHNCRTYKTCQNSGTCGLDVAGAAFCQCALTWIGPYCHKQNDSRAPTDPDSATMFKFISVATFKTNLTREDLTANIRQEIAGDLTNQLRHIMKKHLPGFKNITVDAQSIRIVDGNLVVNWQVTMSSAPYHGNPPELIGDIIQEFLKNIDAIYRKDVVIGDRKPTEGFDFIDATDQIENTAHNPCSSDPCSPGYSFCRALNATRVKCIHNCNVIGDCQNGGVCRLNAQSEPECQCRRQWSGAHCESKIGDGKLDGGEITGIILGSSVIAAGVITCCVCLLCARRRRKRRHVTYTYYSDEESSTSSSDASRKRFAIDRPSVSVEPQPIFGASSNVIPTAPSLSSISSDTKPIYQGAMQKPAFTPERISAAPSKGKNPSMYPSLQ